jgi:hypothetical protein
MTSQVIDIYVAIYIPNNKELIRRNQICHRNQLDNN